MLIVLADEMIDTKLDTIIVLPLTTQIENAERRLRPLLMPRDELLFESQVLVDQPRSLDRAKFGKGPLTRLTESEMKEVEHSLSLILGLDHD